MRLTKEECVCQLSVIMIRSASWFPIAAQDGVGVCGSLHGQMPPFSSQGRGYRDPTWGFVYEMWPFGCGVCFVTVHSKAFTGEFALSLFHTEFDPNFRMEQGYGLVWLPLFASRWIPLFVWVGLPKLNYNQLEWENKGVSIERWL
jgi:hypothetical protein